MVSGLGPLQHSLLQWSMRGSPEPKCTYQPPTTTLTMCREPSLGWAASPRQLHAGSENALRAAQHRTAYADWSSSLLRAGEAFGASACCAVSFVPATSLAARTDFATDGLPSPAPSGVVQQTSLATRLHAYVPRRAASGTWVRSTSLPLRHGGLHSHAHALTECHECTCRSATLA